MRQTLNILGIGPRILLPAVLFAAFAGAATRKWPEVCLLNFRPRALLTALGIVLLAVGVPMLGAAVRAMTRAHGRDQLATTGLFGLVRHPIYSAWIVLILPGLALLSRSWPLLLMPMVAYTAFKLTIRREDEYLLQRFGLPYVEYRRSVNEIFPLPRFRRNAR